MTTPKIFKMRYLAVIILALVLSATAYAFAAANVVPESGAGDGSGVISGYTVQNVTYALVAATPDKINTVTFNIAPTSGAAVPAQVKIKLDASSTTWYNCTVGTSPSWSCAISGGVNTVDADELRVVAAQ